MLTKVVGLALLMFLGIVRCVNADIGAIEHVQDGDLSSGDADATIVMVEYSSLGCASCAEYHKYVLPQLQQKYIDTGKLRYIQRDFPTSRSSAAAAMLAHCAGHKRGKAMEVLLQSQHLWAFNDNYKNVLKKIMHLGGMDDRAFDQCLARESLREEILARALENSKKFDIVHTPTVFINGKLLQRSLSMKMIEKAIESETEKVDEMANRDVAANNEQKS